MKIDHELQKSTRAEVNYDYILKFGDEEINVNVSSENGLLFNNDFDKVHSTGFIVNHNNHRIFYQLWICNPEMPVVFFNHGSAENSSLHSAYIYQCLSEGYNFASFDQEGYGESDGIRGTVKSDSDYFKNMWLAADKVVSVFYEKFKRHPEFYLTSFSAGSPVSLEWYMFETPKYMKDMVKKIILFAPYLRNNRRVLGRLSEFLIGIRNFKSLPLLREESHRAVMSKDAANYIHMNRNISDNREFLERRFKDKRIHRINSLKWLSGMIKRQRKIYSSACKGVFKIPVYCILAENDLIIDNTRALKFMKKIKQSENIRFIKGAYHEFLDYSDERGSCFIKEISALFSQKTGNSELP